MATTILLVLTILLGGSLRWECEEERNKNAEEKEMKTKKSTKKSEPAEEWGEKENCVRETGAVGKKAV